MARSKGLTVQACQCKVDPQNSHKGRTNSPQYCPLTYIQAPWYVDTPPPTPCYNETKLVPGVISPI